MMVDVWSEPEISRIAPVKTAASGAGDTEMLRAVPEFAAFLKRVWTTGLWSTSRPQSAALGLPCGRVPAMCI